MSEQIRISCSFSASQVLIMFSHDIAKPDSRTVSVAVSSTGIIVGSPCEWVCPFDVLDLWGQRYRQRYRQIRWW